MRSAVSDQSGTVTLPGSEDVGFKMDFAFLNAGFDLSDPTSWSLSDRTSVGTFEHTSGPQFFTGTIDVSDCINPEDGSFVIVQGHHLADVDAFPYVEGTGTIVSTYAQLCRPGDTWDNAYLGRPNMRYTLRPKDRYREVFPDVIAEAAPEEPTHPELTGGPGPARRAFTP